MKPIEGIKYLQIRNGKLYRSNIHGTTKRPRLNVFRTTSHIFAQIIDDEKDVTLLAASTMDNFFKLCPQKMEGAALLIGQVIGKQALDAGITEVVLDCDGLYNLRSRDIRILLWAAREAGLKF